ncbi:MAG: hypothetical protein AAF828_08045 [Bacteroidota bacterium]
MKNLFLLFTLTSIFFMSGCSLEQRIINREERLMGTWILDRAFFHEDGNLFRDNVTSDFRGDVVTFFPDFTLLYEAGNGEIFDGFWEISALRDQIDGDNDVEFLIDADFFAFNGQLAFSWVGQITRLGRNNFNVRVQERTGELVLKWDRI